MEAVKDAVLSGLQGAFIHSEPMVILEGLTPEVARKTSSGFDHSCWDLLHHTVIWNDIFLGNIKGNIENWNPENNWPIQIEQENDSVFYDLINHFEGQLNEVRSLVQQPIISFSKKQKISTNSDHELSIIKLYMTIIQHISYHIGQIACVRRMVDNWPLEE